MDIKTLNEEMDRVFETELPNTQEDVWLNKINKVKDYLITNYPYIKLTYHKDNEGFYIINIDAHECGVIAEFKCKGSFCYSSVEFEKWIANKGHFLFTMLAEQLLILYKIELMLRDINISTEDLVKHGDFLPV